MRSFLGRPATPRRWGRSTFLALLSVTGLLAGCGRGCGAAVPPPDPSATSNAPAPAPPPVPEGAIADLGYEVIDTGVYGDAGVRVLLGDADGRGRVCDLFRARDVGAPFRQVRCVDVERSVTIVSDARVVDALEANAEVTLDVPDRGLVRADGGQLTSETTLAAVATRSGVTSVVTEADGRLVLAFFEGLRAMGRAPVRAYRREIAGRPVLAAGALYWLAEDDRGGASFARIPVGDPDAEPERLTGPIASADALHVCRPSAGFVLEARALPVDGTVARTLWFPEGPDLPAASVSLSTPAGADVDVTCRPGEAIFTWVAPAVPDADPRLLVHQTRCRRDRCQTARQPLAVAGDRPVATDLAGQVLVAWTGDDGTRARLGPLVQIDQRPDLAGMPGSDGAVRWRRWLSRAGGALLIEGRTTGVRAVRVTSTGELSPVTPNL